MAPTLPVPPDRQAGSIASRHARDDVEVARTEPVRPGRTPADTGGERDAYVERKAVYVDDLLTRARSWDASGNR
jgi:hypothetical protein